MLRVTKVLKNYIFGRFSVSIKIPVLFFKNHHRRPSPGRDDDDDDDDDDEVLTKKFFKFLHIRPPKYA